MSLEKTFAEIDSVTQSYKTHFAFTDYIRDKLFEHARRDATGIITRLNLIQTFAHCNV